MTLTVLYRLLCILLLTAYIGCKVEQTPAEAPSAFVDDLGREVVLEGPVERVVSLAPSITEMIFAAGAGHKVAGVTTADSYPPAVDTLPQFAALPVDFEAIVRLDPDLALGTDQVNSPRTAETFAALDIPVAFFSFPDLASITAGVRKIGELLDTEATANAAADSMEHELELIRSITNLAEDRPLVLFLIGDETLNSFGDESYMHEVIELAGGRSATENIGANAPVLNDEFVLRTAPEIIILPMGADYDPAHLLANHPTWEVLPAFRNGRVYSLPDEFILPTPRIVEGARRIAEFLHPELFTPPQLAGRR